MSFLFVEHAKNSILDEPIVIKGSAPVEGKNQSKIVPYVENSTISAIEHRTLDYPKAATGEGEGNDALDDGYVTARASLLRVFT